jgi:hypothetical protein
MTTNSIFVWYAISCRRFGEIHCLHSQGRRENQSEWLVRTSTNQTFLVAPWWWPEGGCFRVPPKKINKFLPDYTVLYPRCCVFSTKWTEYVIIYRNFGARSSVVGWGTMLQDGSARVRFPMRSLAFYNLPNSSSHTMALGTTQTLTKMITRNLPGG